jgi:NADH-quinone oxidoreductase subunit L
MAELIWAVPLLPLVGFIINSLLLSYLPAEIRRKIAGWIAAIFSTLAFVVAVYIATNLSGILAGQDYRNVDLYDWIAIAGSPLKIPMGLRIDPLSVTMMLVVTGVGSLIHYFSIGYMADDERVYRFFSYLNLFMFAMLMLVLGSSYALMFVGWEGVGLASYLLIGFFFQRVSAAQAGKKAFLINRVGDFGFLLAMFALFWLTGSLTYNTPDHTGALDQAAKLSTATIFGLPAVTVICLLFFLGATGKSAQLPLYLWLPDAMEGPTPVSALIHAATMVTAGVYLIARSAALFGQSALAQGVIATIGVTTAFFAALTAFRQYDIKRVLAWSTISQLGYMFIGVGVGAYAAGISHLVTHAFFKALMFLGAGAVMHALEGQLDMRKMGNMKRHMPVTHLTFAMGWLAICGIPPFAGFWSKDAILEHVWHRAAHEDPSYWAVYAVGVITAAMTAFYMTRMYVTVFHGRERIEMGDEGHGGDAQEHGASHAPGHGGHGHPSHHGEHGHGHGVHVHPEQKIMNAPLGVLALLSVVGGLVVFLLPGFIYSVTTKTVSVAEHAHSVTLPAPHGADTHAGAETHAEAAKTPSEGGDTHTTEAAAGAEAGGEHGGEVPPAFEFPDFSKSDVLVPTAISTLAGLLGLLWAMFGVGAEKFARGWSPAAERFLAAPDTLYQGTLHAIFVRGGTKLSELLYTGVDRAIDWVVNFVATVVDYFAESLRTLQTGYVRNYALVMLAGAVFVVACFMIILQQTAR